MIIPVLLLQVYGFGVNLLRWMLMAPKYLSFILIQKDLRVLGSPMYTTIGLCSDVCCVPFSDLLFLGLKSYCVGIFFFGQDICFGDSLKFCAYL